VSEFPDVKVLIEYVGHEDYQNRFIEIDQQADAVVKKWDREERRIHSQMSRVIRGIRGVMGLVRNIIHAFGGVLDPVQEALIMSIMTTMTSILTIHRTLEASTMGIAGMVTVGLSLAAIAMSFANLSLTIAEMDKARATMQDAEAIIQSAISMALPATFGGGYYY